MRADSNRFSNRPLHPERTGAGYERSAAPCISARLIGMALMLVALAGNAQTEATQLQDVPPARQADLVVVIKSLRMLYLYRDGMVIHEYPIALGGEPVGDKHRSGDEKTPVGQYIINWRNPNSRFHLSLHISYPNARDRAHARRHGLDPGDNIMIHGQPDYDKRARFGDWTHGCIAVSNDAIDEIWRMVPNGTPIDILP